ncbi:MAG: hypothetical protein ACYC3W_08930 [Candidatus Nanopelagicales bacterium]
MTFYPWAELLARLLSSLAWPAVALVALLILKPQLKALLANATHVKVGIAEISISERLTAGTAAQTAILQVDPEIRKSAEESVPSLEADAEPEARLVDFLQALEVAENSALAVGPMLNLNVLGRNGALLICSELARRGLVPKQTPRLANSLYGIHDKVSGSDPAFTLSDEALSTILGMTRTLQAALEIAASKLRHPSGR